MGENSSIVNCLKVLVKVYTKGASEWLLYFLFTYLSYNDNLLAGSIGGQEDQGEVTSSLFTCAAGDGWEKRMKRYGENQKEKRKEERKTEGQITNRHIDGQADR